MTSRRTFLSYAATLGLTALSPGMSGFLAQARTKGFGIGACDWSLGKTADLTAMGVARQIGLDGVQVSLGTVKDDMQLRRKEVQAAYRRAAEANGVTFSGLAIGELNNVPYKSDPRAEEWVRDSIDVANVIGVNVVLLAFFSDGDLKNDPAGTKVVVERLKKVAPKAEAQGVVLGIESWLSADEHLAIIDAVGSPNVKVYYDVANSTKMGYDIYAEIRQLGREQICEFHMKEYAPGDEYNRLLGQGAVDFEKVRQVIEDVGYTGWMQIEASVPKGAPMLESYVKNEDFLRTKFPERA